MSDQDNNSLDSESIIEEPFPEDHGDLQVDIIPLNSLYEHFKHNGYLVPNKIF